MRVCRKALFIQCLDSGRRVHTNTAKHNQHVARKSRNNQMPTSSFFKPGKGIDRQGVEALVD
jgi:hypothetical protein